MGTMHACRVLVGKPAAIATAVGHLSLGTLVFSVRHCVSGFLLSHLSLLHLNYDPCIHFDKTGVTYTGVGWEIRQ